MNDRPVIHFTNPTGLLMAVGLSAAFWTVLACAILVVTTVSPLSQMLWQARHLEHAVRAHIAQI